MNILRIPVEIQGEDIQKAHTVAHPILSSVKRTLNKENDNLSVPAATIIEEIDKAITNFSGKGSDKVREQAEKELKELLSQGSAKGKEYSLHSDRIKSLTNQYERLKKLTAIVNDDGVARFKEMNSQQLDVLQEQVGEKIDADWNKKVDKLLSLEEKDSKKIERDYKKRVSEINSKIKELEGAKGKEADDQRKDLQGDIEKLRADRNNKLESLGYGKKIKELEKPENPILEYQKAKTTLNNAFKGTFEYKPILPEEKLKDESNVSKKPRTLDEYKKRIEQYKKIGKRPINTKASNANRKRRKAELELKIKTGSEDKPMILSPVGKVTKPLIIESIKQLKLPTYEEEIVQLFTPKEKEVTSRKTYPNDAENALLKLLEELGKEEITRETKIRLKTHGILTNQFLYNLQENITGERNNIHPDIINQLRDNDSVTPKYEELVSTLKEINPKMKITSKTNLKNAMRNLQSAKTSIKKLRHLVMKDPSRFNVSDFRKLSNKASSIFEEAKKSFELKYSENLKDEKKEYFFYYDAALKLVDDLLARLPNIEQRLSGKAASPSMDSVDLDGSRLSLIEQKRDILQLRIEQEGVE